MREPRLGDDIDDFCVRCKRVMNHAIVSVVNGEPAKVRCRTCHSDHDFRREQPPPPKVDLRKQAAFNEVLKKVDPSAEAVATEDVASEDLAVEDVAADLAAVEETAVEAGVGEAVAEEAAPRKQTAAPKGKARAKARK